MSHESATFELHFEDNKLVDVKVPSKSLTEHRAITNEEMAGKAEKYDFQKMGVYFKQKSPLCICYWTRAGWICFGDCF